MATADAASSSSDDERVLAIVGGLVGELNGAGARQPRLDDSLDRDLGISSLERVELLLRIERAFGVRLPDAVMADAATPRDLVTAIGHAAPPAARTPATTAPAPATTAAAIPASARSLVEVLRWHAERTPERVHIHLRDDEGAETPISYGELAGTAAAAANGLTALGVARGDRVALMLRTERAFFDTFLGTLLAGAVPVPLYPPLRAEDLLAYTRRQRAILANSGARVLVTFDEVERLAALIRADVPSLEAITTPPRLVAHGPRTAWVDARPEDPALIQYTSGSTGDPKGVLLSHANILGNVRAIGEALDIGSRDVAVSWLPLYHDMGLIGMWLGALYFGAPAAIMSPLAFLSRPARWLRAIHTHRGTVSAAPNFAFDLCAHKIPDEELEGLDLSSWRLALNGSEGVSPDTIDRFARRFAPYGFRPETMCPAYGLAESSVGLALPRARRPPRIDRVDRDAFEHVREARPAPAGDERALAFVSCGQPLPGHEVRIVDADDAPLCERTEGRIVFRGPSATTGYFRNDAATRAIVHDGWMDTGDLGYVAGGELFVTGREKDLIIVGGRNVRAEEVEEIVSGVAGVRPHCVAAFGVRDASAGTERLVAVAETREQDAGRREALQRAIRDRLVDAIGMPPDAIALTAPRTVLKTSSGKIRRRAMRDAYVNGTLGVKRSALMQRVQLVTGAGDAWIRRAVAQCARAAYTAWILLVLALTVPCLWLYLALSPAGDRANRAVQWWSRFVLRLGGVDIRVEGNEHLREVDSALLVANHASYVDPILVMAIAPGVLRFAAKRGLTRYPIIGTVIRKTRYVTIEKAALSERLAGADDLTRRLRDGGLLCVFPEGTFVRPPGLLPFRLGAFRAAVESERPVVPVAIAGARDVLPDGAWLFTRKPIRITIGPPLSPAGKEWPEIVRLRDAAVEHIKRWSGE